MLHRFTAAALFACSLFAFASAKADSYIFTQVPGGNANNQVFVAGNDYGDFVLRVPTDLPGCNQQANTCFQTRIAATGAISYSVNQPTLAAAPNPIAGTGCPYTGNALFMTCVNGRQFISGFDGPNGYIAGLVEVIGNNFVGVGASGPGHLDFVSPNGNLFYADQFHELLYVGINQDTIPTSATPEPSSLALLGTGVLGLLGAARRRFAV